MDNKTKDYLLDLVSKRPQELCKMCGKCCRVATTEFTYDELLKMKEEGDIQATDFLRVFEPYKSIKDAEKVEPDVVLNIINSLKKSGKYNEKTLTFYGCRYIGKDNKCQIYNERPLMCILAPLTAWAVFPPTCGFLPWLSQMQDEKRKIVLEQKDALVKLNDMLKIATKEEQIARINKCIENAHKIIDYYKKYLGEI